MISTERKELQETDREVTRAEKILALALAVFLLIGGLRVALAINAVFPHPDYMVLREQFIPQVMQQEMVTLWNQKSEKLAELERLRVEKGSLRLQYETAREEYRTLLDRGIDDNLKKDRWEQARGSYEETKVIISAAETTLHDFQDDVLSPKETLFTETEARFNEQHALLTSQRNLWAGLALMFYALFVFALVIWAFNLFRNKPLLSRYAVIGTSFMGFGALQLLVISYNIVYPFLQGLLPMEWIISLGGSSLSIAGIILLKNKFFSAEVVGSRRLWKQSCPACGFPYPGNYCARCGVPQKRVCANCGLLTGRFLPWCQECGNKQKAVSKS